MRYDVAIIGGGIVGLATAYDLLADDPRLRIVILEKERRVATHQTGRNSGVLHAGVYYRPGSYKAQLCTAGREALERFCREQEIPFLRRGKLIVATAKDELSRLDALHRRGLQNGLNISKVGPDEIREREPYVSAKAALWVPETGVISFQTVAERLAAILRSFGCALETGTCVSGATQNNGAWMLEAGEQEFEASIVVNCAGLWADRVARFFDVQPRIRLIPFRGEYVELRESARRYCNGLIYPVPDPSFPFLGVHLTRTVDERVEAGPSAVLAFAREGYKLRTVRISELFDVLQFRGFRKLSRKHWKTGLLEMWRSFSDGAFLRAIQRLVPDIQRDDLLSSPAGVRAQAVFPDGTLADDFVIETTRNTVHVINAPSPAATASLAIGKHIGSLVRERMA